MEFEILEQIALANREQWKSVLEKVTTDNPNLYKYLQLIHTNKDGSNDTAIANHISSCYWDSTTYSRRWLLDKFDKLTAAEKSGLLDEVRSNFGLTLSDTKTDVSVSYAVNFVANLFDPKIASAETLFQKAANSNFSSGEISNPSIHALALEWASKNPSKVDRYTLDRLMENLVVADSPHVVTFLAKQMTREPTDYPKSFGSQPWHSTQLTLLQLEELRKLVPKVLNERAYVDAVLKRLVSPTANIDRDPLGFEKALAPVREFVMTLSHAFNGYKLIVCFNLLDAQIRQGKYVESSLIEYLSIPKNSSYSNYDFLEVHRKRGESIPSIGHEYIPSIPSFSSSREAEVISHVVQHFLLSRTTWEKSFETLVDTYWLKDQFARVKILYGPPAAIENYSSMLNSIGFSELKKQIRLDISPRSSKYWSSASKVALKVEVKNVPKLIVKVFEINTMRYYRENLSEVPSDISLDGLVASEEQQYEYSEPDHVSVWREYTFPSLDGRYGVFVIEFVGAGRSERAVIYKGRLNVVQLPTIAGHTFTIMNEKYEKLNPAHLWMSGQMFSTDEEGLITVPYASSNQSRTVIVYGGDLNDASPVCDLYTFSHATESYQFDAQFHVERESLVPFNKTHVLIKPKLLMNNSIPTPVSLLTDVFLTISTTDLDGISSSKDVPIKFTDDADTLFEFQVPERLVDLSFSLRASIKKLSDNSKVSFSASKNYQLNLIDQTDQIEQIFLRKTPEQGYTLHFLGKTGDAIPRRDISISLTSYFYPQSFIAATVTSDDHGVIPLGHLQDFVKINAQNYEFPLDASNVNNLIASSVLHLKSGQELQVATLALEIPPNTPLQHEMVSLVSICPEHDNVVLADYYHLLRYERGMLSIPRGLLPGTYRLYMKRSRREITIYVQQALQSHSDFLFGTQHILQKSPFSKPLQIAAVSDTEDGIKIELTNSTSSTRVHVFPSEFVPEYDVRDLLQAVPQPSMLRSKVKEAKEAQYVSRELSEEQRYILDRRYAKPRQGNTLTPPSLLLNPWAVDTTRTTRKDAGGGGSYGSSGPVSADYDSYSKQSAYRGGAVNTYHGRNFDFKFHVCKSHYNLKPSEDGIVNLSRAALGGTPGAPLLVRIIAVDATEMVFREHNMKGKSGVAEASIAVKDLRLKQARALTPTEHFAEQKGVTLLQAGEKFQVADLSTSKIEVLDSMNKVYSFFNTISGDANLKDWNWLLKWDSFSVSEKEEKYHEFASHELHLFLYFKDRKFFDSAVLPYIKNKLQPTFIDEWLTITDPAHFTKYVSPGMLGTLNAAEKALLAHRLTQVEGDALAKSLNDLSVAVAFSKNDRPNFNRLFKTILGSSSLDTESDGYVPEQEIEADELEQEYLPPPRNETMMMPPPSPSVMMAAPMMSSFGAAPMAFAAAPPPTMARRSSLMAEEREAPRKEAKKRSVAPEKLLEKRSKAAVQLYQAPEKTKKYAESQYYKQADPKQSRTLVPMNAFWSDYALHRSQKGSKGFISKNFIYATNSFAEMVMAIAVMDLPLSRPATPHATEYTESGMTLTASGPVVIFHKDVKACPLERRQVLVAQTFFDPQDRHTVLNGERVEKYIEEEFLNRKVYGCNYVITNVSSSTQRVEVLLQVPVGSMPVLSGSLTKSVFMEVPSYTTQSGQFYFYFPRIGDFASFPVHVSRDEKTVAFATMQLPDGKPQLHVVNQLSKHDKKSWNSYISQLAPNDEVFDYLQKEDIFTVDLAKIAWRMLDATFFKKATDILRSRNVFNKRLWAYAVRHQDKTCLAELFNAEMDRFRAFVGINATFASFPTVTTDAWATRATQHFEFWPLINARTHQLGATRQILNDGFKTAYRTFLTDLTWKKLLSKNDLLIATYFMLLQDRVEDAIKLFERALAAPLEAGSCPETVGLQTDYLRAYLDFFNEKPTIAREICTKYLDYPILRWRRMFAAVKQQLDEFDTGVRPSEMIDPDDRNTRMGKAAHHEPTLEVETVPGKILLNHHSLTTATLSFYKMDIELLFSSADYKPTNLGKFAYVKPNYSITVPLATEGNETAVTVPKELDNCNVMIEVTAGPHSKVVSYFSHSLLVKVSEQYGQIQVHDKVTGRPLSRVYIKVFSENKDGSNRFYKDGYTDLRGAFDYASLSTDELGNVKKFSILVMSLNNGTRILEAAPPTH